MYEMHPALFLKTGCDIEQIRWVQARLDEGAGALEPIRRDVGQAWAGQPPAGEIRHLP
jgi:hypothetical protein